VELLVTRGRLIRHRSTGFGQEVLDDHFLDVTELFVRGRDRLQRGDTLLACLTDPNQQSGGEGNLQFPGEAKVSRRRCGSLSGPIGGRRGRRAPQSSFLRRRDRAQLGQFVTIERTGVGVREQSRALEHHLGRVRDVVDR